MYVIIDSVEMEMKLLQYDTDHQSFSVYLYCIVWSVIVWVNQA